MSNSDQEPSPPIIEKSPIPLDDCGMATAASVIGDRWSLLVLRAALYGIRRFEHFKSDLNISSATLTDRLNKLTAAGLLVATPYRSGTARTRMEYFLTEEGQALKLALHALMNWGDRYLRQAPSALVAVSTETGEALSLGFTDQRGQAVREDEVEIRARVSSDDD